MRALPALLSVGTPPCSKPGSGRSSPGTGSALCPTSPGRELGWSAGGPHFPPPVSEPEQIGFGLGTPDLGLPPCKNRIPPRTPPKKMSGGVCALSQRRGRIWPAQAETI